MNKYKIVLVGPTSAGKSTFLYAASDEQNEEFNKYNKNNYTPTIGVDYGTKKIDYKGEEIKIQIWDTAGQERFDSIVQNYFRNIDMAILIIDINDQNYKNTVEKWINKVCNISGKKPFIVIANKKDIEEKKKNIQEIKEIKMMENIINYFEISCYDKDNINYVIDYISNYIINDQNFHMRKRENSIELISSKKKNCCY